MDIRVVLGVEHLVAVRVGAFDVFADLVSSLMKVERNLGAEIFVTSLALIGFQASVRVHVIQEEIFLGETFVTDVAFKGRFFGVDELVRLQSVLAVEFLPTSLTDESSGVVMSQMMLTPSRETRVTLIAIQALIHFSAVLEVEDIILSGFRTKVVFFFISCRSCVALLYQLMANSYT